MASKHITQAQLKAFHNNCLNQEEYILLLEHISECTHCAEVFSSSFTQQETISAPHYLKESILTQLPGQSTPFIPKERQNFIQNSLKKRLFLYSLRVATAVCASIYLLLCTNFTSTNEILHCKTIPDNLHHIRYVNKTVQNVSNELTKKINDFIYSSEKKSIANIKEDIFND